MKKIDLHIHTVKSKSDKDFDFSLDRLEEYVKQAKLDCIAITNHNLFDLNQFDNIKNRLGSLTVLPGIEIDLCDGHILVISDCSSLDEFNIKANCVRNKVEKLGKLTVEDFKEIYPDYNRYLLIPHYDKDPRVPLEVIRSHGIDVFVGEVSSPKKFMYAIKQGGVVPVLFSDCRLERTTDFPSRQTFVDIGEVSLKALMLALKDKNKVSLSEDGSHELISVNNGEIQISTGLNIVLGKRSSGKTHTLDLLEASYGKNNVTYIKQFELLNQKEHEQKKRFDEMMTSEKSSLFEEYISEFKSVVDDILNTNTENEDFVSLENYLDSLVKYAKDENLKDIYSNCSLYNESPYIIVENNELLILIKSVKNLLENTKFGKIIGSYISRIGLESLFEELMRLYSNSIYADTRKALTNQLVLRIQEQLHFNSSTNRVSSIDFYKIARNQMKRKKFEQVCSSLKKERTIKKLELPKFCIEAKTKLFVYARELSRIYAKKQAFAPVFELYDSPLKYLEALDKAGVDRDQIYKLFITIDYQILNEYELPVSGGELSEFNLIQAIQDARNSDLLLIDEPESSFDNLFLKDSINTMLKGISRDIPVVIVTHNSTVGASINPDYLIYTERSIEDHRPKFRIYHGHPSDKYLHTCGGKQKENFLIQINSLEAGKNAYEERRRNYENLEN